MIHDHSPSLQGRAGDASPPKIGRVYRSATGQEFVVLSALRDTLLIEFADGRVRRIAKNKWPRLLS